MFADRKSWLNVLFLFLLGAGHLTAFPQTFVFKEPGLSTYELQRATNQLRAAGAAQWIKATASDDPAKTLEFGQRVVVKVKPDVQIKDLVADRPLTLSRQLEPGLFILEAADAFVAAQQATELALLDVVEVAYPVIRRKIQLQGSYSPRPNDKYFADQWHLENRAADGTPTGADLNIRAAWPYTRGAGVVIAVADDGIDLEHPDLKSRASLGPHYNFIKNTFSGLPTASGSSHGTAVAGLVAATANNKVGVAGVAPEARLASWVILDSLGGMSDELLMDMYQYRSDVVAVQNHSWGLVDVRQNHQSYLERLGITNAVILGRSGRGVVLTRAAGNEKGAGQNANDEAQVSDPNVIAVSAVRRDGRVTSYADPGACVLVAAPSGDEFPTNSSIVTTDRLGSLGYNTLVSGDSANYAFGEDGFSGTSAASPQIAGVAALLLAVNPRLTVRDVQHILALSARHYDFDDHALSTNRAGYRVSPNVGFGVPDAGEAVRLASSWPLRPKASVVSVSSTETRAIREHGLLEIQGAGLPSTLNSPSAVAGLGIQPQAPTALIPLVDVGLADATLSADLKGKGAFIQRGEIYFWEKLRNVAARGAELAIVWNNKDSTKLLVMAATDFSPIPSVFINEVSGRALLPLVQAGALKARLNFNDSSTPTYTLSVTNRLVCEHVSLRVRADHPRRGDLRITLVSPSGTRSVMQQKNFDTSPGPVNWTYHSTQHFFESSFGDWKVFVTDLELGETGSIRNVELIIHGVEITDNDADGLDDVWENKYYNSLAARAAADDDQDGFSNSREFISGTDPRQVDIPFTLTVSPWNGRIARISWRGSAGRVYEIWSGSDLAKPLELRGKRDGRNGVNEFFFEYSPERQQFFRVIAR